MKFEKNIAFTQLVCKNNQSLSGYIDDKIITTDKYLVATNGFIFVAIEIPLKENEKNITIPAEVIKYAMTKCRGEAEIEVTDKSFIASGTTFPREKFTTGELNAIKQVKNLIEKNINSVSQEFNSIEILSKEFMLLLKIMGKNKLIVTLTENKRIFIVKPVANSNMIGAISRFITNDNE